MKKQCVMKERSFRRRGTAVRTWFVLALSLILAVSLAGCKKNGGGQADGGQASSTDPLEVLNTVWESYEDDERFAVAGGDMSEENMTMDGPGTFGLEDTDALDSTLGFPSELAGDIDSAASLVHMMNANTFTCGAFHMSDAEKLSSTADSLKEHILKRQWLCGFPDKLVIASVGDCVVSFFGENEIVDTFKTKLTGAYPSAEILCEEPIA